MQEKNWFKVYPKSFLQDDSLKDIRLRGAFISILALAKVSNNNGQLLDQLDKPLSAAAILDLSGIDQTDLDSLITNGLLVCNQKLHFVKNWLKYQSEYDRQKHYRKGVTKSTQETEIEIETRDRDLRQKQSSTHVTTNVKGLINVNDVLTNDEQSKRLRMLEQAKQID